MPRRAFPVLPGLGGRGILRGSGFEDVSGEACGMYFSGWRSLPKESAFLVFFSREFGKDGEILERGCVSCNGNACSYLLQ